MNQSKKAISLALAGILALTGITEPKSPLLGSVTAATKSQTVSNRSTVIASTVPFSSAIMETSRPANLQTIKRVDSMTESGLVRSHFEDTDGNTYSDTSAGESETNSLTGRKASALPAKYDLRTENLTTSIKDQGVTGCCWAFSAIKTIESNCIKNGLFPADHVDFSESHLVWFSYHPSTNSEDTTYWDGINSSSSSTNPFAYGADSQLVPYETGGSAILANFTLAKWSGVELEENAPFTADTTAQERNMASAMSQKNNARYDSYAHLQNVINFDEYSIGENYYYKDTSMITRMKQAIMDYGAMSVSLFYDKSFAHPSANGTAYFQTYFKGSTAVKNANHAVTIVGWDDNYARSNFNGSPSGNGAWLIANSYGTEEGDEGYFWLSYYDPSICDCSSFLVEDSTNYQHIYQYDGFGWGTATYSGSHDIKAANIFTANETSAQQLKAVSFYTLTDDQPYQIQVYRKVGLAPTDGTLIEEATTTGTEAHNGYHTVSLASPVNIAAGEQFSVIVNYLQEGSRKVYVPLEGQDSTDSTLNISYGSKKGQSFLYTSMSNSSAVKWMDTSANGYNNVCIKAFTNDTDTAEELPDVVDTVKLGKGETYQIDGDYVSYMSNDPDLLSVSEFGQVKTLKQGITSVTVSTETESYRIRFKAKKAPTKITLKPSGKKYIKRGKSFRLKVKFPSGSYSRKLTFRSNRPRYASVSSDGKVRARKKGKATITARAFNGKKAKIQLVIY